MFCVIFIVHPKAGKKDTYLELAKFLKPGLEQIDGFIDNERSASSSRDGFILSLSSWRDEKSLIRWRTQGKHHGVQLRGRNEVFADYHLRIAEVTLDDLEGAKNAFSGTRFDQTEVGLDKVCVISEYTYPDENAFRDRGEHQPPPDALGLLGFEPFSGITNPLREVVLSEWINEDAAQAWDPGKQAGFTTRHRRVRVIRDYSMHDRREAPQYYPASQSTSGEVPATTETT